MRILVTNDDGISAPGLVAAEKIAAALAPEAEIWTVAPMAENSGVGHCISYTKPVRADKLGPHRFAIDGTPADCVLVGLGAIMAETPPDLIISGVNAGNNSGENTLYSGTLGAAMEGALQGVPSVALSQFYGPRNNTLENVFETAEAHGADVLRRLLDNAPFGGKPYGVFYNINFPPVPAAEVQGMVATCQGRREGTNFTASKYDAPNRRTYYWIHGGSQQVSGAPGTDIAVNQDGYISVTPCIADLTERDALDAVRAALSPE